MAQIVKVNLPMADLRELALLACGKTSPEWQRLARSGAWDPLRQTMAMFALVVESGAKIGDSPVGLTAVSIPGTPDQVVLSHRIGGLNGYPYNGNATNTAVLWAAALAGLLKRDGSYASVVEYASP